MVLFFVTIWVGSEQLTAEPYISFVLWGRNDNYGGNLVHKLELSLNFLIDQLTEYELDAEIVFVEWNPPRGVVLLRKVLRLRRSEGVALRFITVPGRFHRRLRHWNRMPGAIAASNTGIRRARGQFVVMRVCDVFYSEELVQFLARRELRTDRVYRLNRVDVPADVLDAPVDDRQTFLDRCVASDFVEHFEIKRPYVPGGLSLHTNGCGDFLLASRRSWELVRGNMETGTTVHFDTDGLALYALVASGLEQELLPSTHRVFKVRHGNTALLRNREEPLTPLVGEFELTLIQDLDAELRRSGVIVEDLGDLIRFVVRLMFDEPRRGVQGVGIVDYASYTEYLYRTWLLSERRRFPLLVKLSRLPGLLNQGVARDIKEVPRLRRRLASLACNLWVDYCRLDRRLFSYRRLLGRLFYLASFGLSPRPYILNGRRWGLGKVNDLLDQEPALYLD